MPSANQRVGEYILTERIAAGTFGEVWKAHHHVWVDQFVAVKIPTDPQYLRNLQSEGTAVHGLQHPNIVRAIGFDPYASPAYLAMEYVPGTSLRPLIGALAQAGRRGRGDAAGPVGAGLRPQAESRSSRHQAGEHPGPRAGRAGRVWG